MVVLLKKIETQKWVQTNSGLFRIDFVLTMYNGIGLYIELDDNSHIGND